MAKHSKEKMQFEELSSYSSQKEYKKHRKKRGGFKKFLLILCGFLCVVLIIAGGGMMYISANYLSSLSTGTITKNAEDLGINEMNLNLVQDDSIKNIALFGLDTRKDTFEGQADVTMILTVDNRHNKIKMTSLMRDSEVRIEGQGFNDYIDWNYKINAAYALGGAELAIRTINSNFGLDITDYVTMNFARLAEVIDAFGGVDMELTAGEVLQTNMNINNLMWEIGLEHQQALEEGRDDSDVVYVEVSGDDFLPMIDPSCVFEEEDSYAPGVYHLNGAQAVAYGRIRAIGDDFERVQRQQKVLKKLMGKVSEIPISDYPGIIKSLLPLCETSLDLSDIISMVPIVAAGFTVESISVPDFDYEVDLHDDPENYNLIFDIEQASHRISSFIYEEGSPYWEEYGGDTGASAAS